MTTSRLSGSSNGTRPPNDPKERIRFWIERGNRILWGEEATSKGDYLTPRRDLEWAWNNGSYFLQPRFSVARSGEEIITQNGTVA
jgi:hypothetical protein